MVVKIKQNLVPTSKYSIKCPYTMKAEYITYHNTANDATAANEINYMKNNNNQVSYHIAVDDKEAIQGIPFNRNAWHCGDGQGAGNRKSIGVEVCYSKSGGPKFETATRLAHKVIAQLLHERGWGVNRVKKHQDWSGKFCPHRILSDKRWNWVISDIQNELNKLKAGKPTQKPTPNKPSKDVDEMARQLPKTQQNDMRNLLAKAYKDKTFSTDHTSKVNKMTRGEAVDLLVSYVARTTK